MAYNEHLANRIREALSHLPLVEEKKMFGSLAFIVNGKMCITAGTERIMCRINPARYLEAIDHKGVEVVKMRGREYKGYVYVNEKFIATRETLSYWINLVLQFNEWATLSNKK